MYSDFERRTPPASMPSVIGRGLSTYNLPHDATQGHRSHSERQVVVIGQEHPGEALTVRGLEAETEPSDEICVILRRLVDAPPFQASLHHMVAAAYNMKSSLSRHRPDSTAVVSCCRLFD